MSVYISAVNLNGFSGQVGSKCVKHLIQDNNKVIRTFGELGNIYYALRPLDSKIKTERKVLWLQLLTVSRNRTT